MCTAIFDNSFGAFFGRTLDLECSFGERVMRINKGDPLRFVNGWEAVSGHSFLGMAYPAATQPLFYDAVNDGGLCAAALNFPHFSVYRKRRAGAINLASFEVIPFILSRCVSVREALKLLENAVITSDDFSTALKSTTLHWMIADKERAAVIESVAEGLRIYDNPFGVMTNSPPFPYHTARICDYAYLSSDPQENRLTASNSLAPYSRGLGAFGLPGDYSSSSRFVRALFAKEHTQIMPCALSSSGNNEARQRIFDILSTVSLPYGIAKTENGEPIYTVYTSCIDMERLEYSYFSYADRNTKIFKF